MLDEREIDIEIARLEYAESSYPSYAKLADLYTIKNQMHRGELPDYESGYSGATGRESRTVEVDGSSDFLQAVSGKDSAAAWAIMDELMETLAMVNERVYRRIMQKIREI